MKRAAVIAGITLVLAGGGAAFALNRDQPQPIQTHTSTISFDGDKEVVEPAPQKQVEAAAEAPIEDAPSEPQEPAVTMSYVVEKTGIIPNSEEARCFVSLFRTYMRLTFTDEDAPELYDRYNYAVNKYGDVCSALAVYSRGIRGGDRNSY